MKTKEEIKHHKYLNSLVNSRLREVKKEIEHEINLSYFGLIIGFMLISLFIISGALPKNWAADNWWIFLLIFLVSNYFMYSEIKRIFQENML